jgi:iron complex outermembrane receptor protein
VNGGFAASIEYRDESGSTQPSAVVSLGESGGNFADPTSGSFDVWETFAELDVPLITGAALADELSVQGAVRYSDYDLSGSETTWKLGSRWDVNEQIAFRGQVSTGFRAPNILELLGGLSDSFTAVTDPCNQIIQATSTTIAANCRAQGIPADWTQPASQLKISQGGNPALKAETSDNVSFGVILTPSIIPNLRVALDWYDIEIEDAISTPDAVQVITTCYESTGLTAPECSRIGRGPGRDVVRFDLLLENLDRVETSGIDINTSYMFDTPYGALNFDWLVTWLDEFTETTATGAVAKRAGLVTCDVCDFSAYPEWRSYFNVGMDITENWSGNFTWRYIDAMDIEDGIGVEGYTFTTPSISYLDAFVTYETDKTKYMVGVENIADKQPPYVPGTANNTSTVYDYLGRTMFARATVRF